MDEQKQISTHKPRQVGIKIRGQLNRALKQEYPYTLLITIFFFVKICVHSWANLFLFNPEFKIPFNS
jgi:hypothetical protein